VLIDWFTIIAQIINFLILLWLLKRFLYKPIMNAMNEREKKITHRLTEAERARIEAEKQAEEYQHRTAELENQRESLLQGARNEADALRKELLHQARQEVTEVQERWHRAIQQEKEAFLRDLYQRASTQTYEIARKALSDLANKDLETHIVENFLLRIQNLGSEERASVENSLANSNGRITVRSTFEIPDHLREQIASRIESVASNRFELIFETFPEVLCGIELKLAGKKISWSLASYLDALQENLSEALQTRVQELDQVTTNDG
jgi:F-type H+-transporting ATPase subunit b